MAGRPTLRFVKGHGTENDFVLLPDPDGEIDLSPRLVRALCDRRAGIGGDGVLRVVRTAAVPEVRHLAAAAEWFMDYRNADGSLAEMCGNGVRVYARYLVSTGLAAAGELPLATRGGVRTASLGVTGEVTVDMGVPGRPDRGPVRVGVDGRQYAATVVSLGNPHLVVPVAGLGEAGELRQPPVLDPVSALPDGANVEFVLGRGPGRIAVRVHERGVGETRSCGTGACAAAVAAADWWDAPRPLRYDVQLPGGRLQVAETETGSLRLTGPAVLVGTGEVYADWLSPVAATSTATSAAGGPPTP